MHCMSGNSVPGMVLQYEQISLIVLLKYERMGNLLELYLFEIFWSRVNLMSDNVNIASQKKLFKQTIIRCFISNQDIMRVTFGHTGIGDTNKLCIFLHLHDSL